VTCALQRRDARTHYLFDGYAELDTLDKVFELVVLQVERRRGFPMEGKRQEWTRIGSKKGPEVPKFDLGKVRTFFKVQSKTLGMPVWHQEVRASYQPPFVFAFRLVLL
jgi:hypothetical protein